jgi:hypothetical protein
VSLSGGQDRRLGQKPSGTAGCIFRRRGLRTGRSPGEALATVTSCFGQGRRPAPYLPTLFYFQETITMKWLRRFFAPAVRPCPASSRQARPTLEALEDRQVPTVASHAGLAAINHQLGSLDAVKVADTNHQLGSLDAVKVADTNHHLSNLAAVGVEYAVGQFSGQGTAQGVWRWSSTAGWQELLPGGIAPLVAVDGYGDVVANLYQGVWLYTGGWRQLTPLNASSLAIAGHDNIVGAFGSGVYRWEDATGWQLLSTATATSVSIDAQGDVVGEFPYLGGVWRFEDATGWQHLAGDAFDVAIAGNGNVVGDFTGSGVWRWEDSQGWQLLSTADVSSLGINARGDVVGDFDVLGGVFRFQDATGWQQLTTFNGQASINDAGDVLVGGFQGQGVFLLDTFGDAYQLTPRTAFSISLASS